MSFTLENDILVVSSKQGNHILSNLVYPIQKNIFNVKEVVYVNNLNPTLLYRYSQKYKLIWHITFKLRNR